MIYSRWEQSTDLYTHHHILSCYFSYSWFMLLWSIVNLTKNLEALKDLTGRDWGQEKKGTTEDELAEWHHWLDGRESEWTPGVADGQGGLVCCDSWGHKGSDTTERLNWTEMDWSIVPGSSPGGSRVIRRGDGIGVLGKTYLITDIKRD